MLIDWEFEFFYQTIWNLNLKDLPEEEESTGNSRCNVWSIETPTKLMLWTNCSNPLELSTPVCPDRSCFLVLVWPKPLFIKLLFARGLYKEELGEEGRFLSWIKLISCCWREVPLELEERISGVDRLSCRGHFLTSFPPTEYIAFCHSVYKNMLVTKDHNTSVSKLK